MWLKSILSWLQVREIVLNKLSRPNSISWKDLEKNWDFPEEILLVAWSFTSSREFQTLSPALQISDLPSQPPPPHSQLPAINLVPVLFHWLNPDWHRGHILTLVEEIQKQKLTINEVSFRQVSGMIKGITICGQDSSTSWDARTISSLQRDNSWEQGSDSSPHTRDGNRCSLSPPEISLPSSLQQHS